MSSFTVIITLNPQSSSGISSDNERWLRPPEEEQMKITSNIKDPLVEGKVFNILSIVKSKIITVRSGKFDLVEVAGATYYEKRVHLKIVARASCLRDLKKEDKLEIEIEWGIFSDEPAVRKIKTFLKRTADGFCGMLFQFGIPREGGPKEEAIIAEYIIHGIIESMKSQKSFLDLESQLISKQIKEIEKIKNN